MMIKGVLSDMDGVILDSEKLYVRFWCEAGQACGFPMEKKHALGIRSMARPYAIEKLQGWFGESSSAMQSSGRSPSFFAAARYISGAGLP